MGAEAQTANVSFVDSGNAVTLVCIREAIGTQGEFLPFSEVRGLNSNLYVYLRDVDHVRMGGYPTTTGIPCGIGPFPL